MEETKSLMDSLDMLKAASYRLQKVLENGAGERLLSRIRRKRWERSHQDALKEEEEEHAAEERNLT
jgi:hypothetical protein